MNRKQREEGTGDGRCVMKACFAWCVSHRQQPRGAGPADPDHPDAPVPQLRARGDVLPPGAVPARHPSGWPAAAHHPDEEGTGLRLQGGVWGEGKLSSQDWVRRLHSWGVEAWERRVAGFKHCFSLIHPLNPFLSDFGFEGRILQHYQSLEALYSKEKVFTTAVNVWMLTGQRKRFPSIRQSLGKLVT